jgi:hypothetical protein
VESVGGRRRGLWKPSVSELPSSAPDMSEAEEDDPERDGDGGSWWPAAVCSSSKSCIICGGGAGHDQGGSGDLRLQNGGRGGCSFSSRWGRDYGGDRGGLQDGTQRGGG